MYLVTQSFGRESEYRRVILTILSYFAYSDPAAMPKVLLFTDNPQFFNSYFEGLPVEYVLLTPEKIRDMRGNIDFLHRMKVALIEEAFDITGSSILYTDSDTFFIADPLPLFRQVSAERSFMHLWEYRFEEMRHLAMPAGKTFRAFLSLIESRTFKLADGRPIKVSPQHVSWNAGVMMFHASHARLIPDVYALTEQFYPDSLNHASEQYAFSVVLQENTEVRPCDSVVYHYWYHIKKQIIDEFLAVRMRSGWQKAAASSKLHDVQEWTQLLPSYFEKHIWTIRDNAIQSFNERRFREGYKWTLKAMGMDFPGDTKFIKDVLYHTKSFLLKKEHD